MKEKNKPNLGDPSSYLYVEIHLKTVFNARYIKY